MNLSKGLLPTVPRLLCLQACIMMIAASTASAQLAPTPAADATTTTTTTTTAPTPGQTRTAAEQSTTAPVVLSPFEVVSDTRGYYSANTEAGTRINSKIDDLGAAISIVTKQQMQDFAMLDINDVFLYTPNAVGTGTYTDNTVDRNGSVSDNGQMNPSGANRIRGLASANIARDNFEAMTSGTPANNSSSTGARVPIDPIDVDGVEISRGPNASVFGLGNASGTVNEIMSKANLSRDFSRVTFRADNYSGYRTSIDVNRALTPKLAVRVSAAFQHDGFERKPSGVNTERYNAMIQYKPFRWTTINASYRYYKSNGNRPNDAMPRDSISYWASQGKPTWDPVAQVIHVNGTTIGPITANTFPTTFAGQNVDYFNNGFTGSNHGYAYIDQNGLGYWTAPTTFDTASGPTSTFTGGKGNPSVRMLMSPSAGTGIVSGKPSSQPLFSTTPSVTSKAIYDYTSVNLAAINRTYDRDYISEVSIDQILLDTPMQTLAVQGAFYREDSQRYLRNIIGIANSNGQSGQLLIDVNERNLDGTPNAFFLRPYIGQDQPQTYRMPAKWDTYRLQAAYKLDFTQKKDSWLKWLGLHQLSAYDDYKFRINRTYGYKDAIADPQNHSWIPPGLSVASQHAIVGGTAAALNITRDYFRYYVGNANNTGQVNYAPTEFKYGRYPFIWGNQLNGVFTPEMSSLAQVEVPDDGGGPNNSKIILKSMGAVLQSHLLNDELVTTFGEREDKQYQKSGAVPVLLNADGTSLNHATSDAWIGGDYNFHSGKTTQAGAVWRPFKDFTFVHDLSTQDSPVGKFLGQLLGGMSLSMNKSNSFIPQNFAENDFQQQLPNSNGTGVDYGLGLNLFDGKFVASVRRYDTKVFANRNGDAGTIAQRVLRIDIASTATFLLVNQATNWVSALNPTFSTAQVQAEVGRQMGLDYNGQILALQNAFNAGIISSTNDVEAKGTEVELNYNPTRFWTLTANGSDTKAINSNVSGDIQAWLANRLPIWTTIVDPRTNTLWWTTNYTGSNGIPANNYQSFVASPFLLTQQQQGKAIPTISRYNFRLATNFQLAGITDNPILKHFNVGGAIRWQSAQAIGYYGVQSLPATITALDPNKPVYYPAQAAYDALVGYKTVLFGGRIPTSIQLNVRDIERPHYKLQPIHAFPDGTADSYRILDPTQYILQVSFDL